MELTKIECFLLGTIIGAYLSSIIFGYLLRIMNETNSDLMQAIKNFSKSLQIEIDRHEKSKQEKL